MFSKINQVLLRFLEKNNDVEIALEKLTNAEHSQLIEIVGDSGTGKSYLAKSFSNLLKEKKLPCAKYEPKTFQYNQLKEIVLLMSNIDEKQFDSYLVQSKRYTSESKYDFFYFISSQLNTNNQFESKYIIIDNVNLLDHYTQQFIQYIVEYTKNKKIHFIVFSTEDSFPFAYKQKIKYLTKENIQTVLENLYKKESKELISDSELLFTITKGNIALLEEILNQFIKGNTLLPLDLTSYLDKKTTYEKIFLNRIKKLTEERKQILLATYFLEDLADFEHFSLLKNVTNLNKHLDFLLNKEYLTKTKNNRYTIEKKSIYNQYYSMVQEQTKKTVLKAVYPILEDEFHDDMKRLARYVVEKQTYKKEILQAQIDYLLLLNDYESLRILYQFMLNQTTVPKEQAEILTQLGVMNLKLNELEVATEFFRRALRISTNNHLPAEKIVFHLAESLFANKSSTFALEVVKKFSPREINPYWAAKLYILKAEILIYQEEFEDGMQQLDEVFNKSIEIKDPDLQKLIQAESKKMSGRIYYEEDQWDQAEVEFRKAEKLYKRIDNVKGLAAVYNNIGVLALLQGDWDRAEKLYQQSLELEEKRYSLDGISVCYNNIGYLVEEKVGFEESLEYFNNALRIQKLLSNSYNIANIYNNIGVTYMNNGDYKKAVETTENSLEIAMKFNLYRIIIAALNNLGSLYFKWGDWNKAIEYYEFAIDRSKEHNFWEGLLRSYNNLGEVYQNKSDYNVAYDLYFKGLEILPNVSDESLRFELRVNLGSVLTHLHKYEEAYPYLIESYEYFNNLSARDHIVACSLNLAFYFEKTRNYESAKYYINKAITTAEEINDQEKIGKSYLLQAELERKNIDEAQKSLEKAIEIFVATKNNYELSIANYEYASILYKKRKWEQALQILKNNEKVIKQFGAINLLEKNDLLIQKISKEYAIELKETKSQESLLNKFYEITSQLNSITDFELLLETSLENIKQFSEADGGILCLYNNRSLPDSWEYKIFNRFNEEDESYETMMDIIHQTYTERRSINHKQPHFASLYNNIITFPMVIRNQIFGVILLYTKTGSHYFTEKMSNLISALSNQIVVIIENIRHVNLAKSHAIIREELSDANIFSNIIGKSPAMMKIFSVIDRIKDAPTTVLLEGPSGTGKELFARAVHYTSNRRNKKFIAQYCGALPETLLESELFGHVKGSFTGAAYDKKGLLEIADGGTFFLDEIADISLSTQAKLLRFLQEGEVKRVGSTKTQKVNVRVVCATNVSLKEKVDKGEFRLDLYYRLNVIKISVPALKSRQSDIPLLAIHFLDKYNNKIGKGVKGITDEAMKYLMKCEWPGNIRQLENEIERAVTLAENEAFIKPSDLSEEIFKFAEHSETIEMLDQMTLKEAVENLEKRMIHKALKMRGWNQTQAAKDLGLSRQGLIKKIKRYNIEK